MKPKQTLILLAIVAAAIACIVAYQYLVVPKQNAKSQEESLFFPGLDPAKADRIDIARGDTVSVLTRPASGDTAWVVQSMNDFPADQEAVKNGLNVLKGLKQSTPASEEKSSQERLGVDQKGLHVTVKAGNTVAADLIVGKQGSNWGTAFVRRPENDKTYLVYENLDSLFNKKNGAWRDKKIFNVNADDITEIKLTKSAEVKTGNTAEPAPAAAQTLTLRKDKATGDWGMVTHGDSVEKLDKDKVSAVARNLGTLMAADFADQTTPEDAGLTPPAMTVEFSTTDGKAHTLMVGKKDEQKYFVKRADRSVVQTVYQYNVTNIFKDPEALKPLPGGGKEQDFDMSNMLPAPQLGAPGPEGGGDMPMEGETP
jgi:hypothetical protein